MNDSAFDDPRDYCTDEGDGKGVVDVELEWSFCIVMAMMRKDVQESPDEIQRLSSHIGDLEDRAYPLGNELSSCVDTLFPILDEDWDFACAWGFEDSRDLLNSLFEDLRWADVDFGDDYHDWDIQGQCDTKMLFTHSDETVVRCYHQ